MFKNYNSQEPSVPSKWEDRNITIIRPDESIVALTLEIKKNTETAANYSRYYHDHRYDDLIKLLHPTCQFGTFFGFVWGPTAVKIALMEESKMTLRFIGKLLTYSSHHENTFWKEKSLIATDGNNNNNVSGSDNSSLTNSSFSVKPKNSNSWFGGWAAPADAGLNITTGAPAFARVTEHIFERDGIARKNHRGFPYNVWDKFMTLRVRETIVVEEGLVTSRVLQNLTAWMPLPYDFM